ncbi:transcriptional regulator, IclR family [Desulfosarcina variabilis str. Montpellier]|uniref:IclR family transcriptional regulator n=1 Tax=Desulfosarcina variabilis TaxID=2300 RepID=UPI003AFA267F
MANSRQFVESLNRGFKLLSIVCKSTTPLSLSELSKQSNLSISTIQRLTYTLQQMDLIDRDHQTKKFKIGPEMITLSFTVIDNLALKKVAFPYMQELNDQINEVVSLAVFSGTQIILIDSIETQQILNVSTSGGVSIPVHATASGKAMLAYIPDDKADFLLSKLSFEKFTENTITSIQAFKAQLQKVRENGFAWSIEESNYGLNTVAAPIRRNDGDVLAALLVLVPTVRVSEAKLINEYGPQVAKMAKRISFDMGFREKDAE